MLVVDNISLINETHRPANWKWASECEWQCGVKRKIFPLKSQRVVLTVKNTSNEDWNILIVHRFSSSSLYVVYVNDKRNDCTHSKNKRKTRRKINNSSSSNNPVRLWREDILHHWKMTHYEDAIYGPLRKNYDNSLRLKWSQLAAASGTASESEVERLVLGVCRLSANTLTHAIKGHPFIVQWLCVQRHYFAHPILLLSYHINWVPQIYKIGAAAKTELQTNINKCIIISLLLLFVFSHLFSSLSLIRYGCEAYSTVHWTVNRHNKNVEQRMEYGGGEKKTVEKQSNLTRSKADVYILFE